jgi:outer membrane protein
MKSNTITLLALSLFTITLAAQEQDSWSLDKCIVYAMENNISLKREELSAELDRRDLAQSKLDLLPDLNGQIEHNLGAGRVLDRGTYQWVNTDVSQGDLGVASRVTLFGGFTGYNTIKMSEAGSLISRARLEQLGNNIQLQVMTGYLELLQKTELYEIALEKVNVTALQVRRMEQLREVGNASTGEVLEVKAQLSTEKYNMTMAKNAMDVARLTLVQLLNLPDPGSFNIEKPAIPDPSLLQVPDMETVYARAVETLPQVRGAEQNINYQEKNLAVERGRLSPELYLRALYYSNYSDKLINPREVNPSEPVMNYPVPQQVYDNQYRQVTIGLNIPVFNKWQQRTNISKAKIGLQDAQYALEHTKQQLFKEVQQYHSDVKAAYDKYQAAVESRENSEEAFRYAEEKFNVGMATALELEEARNRLFAARAEQVSARYLFVFYLEILDFYQGEEILLI